jgi:two-component system sensor histidine kinase FlrB
MRLASGCAAAHNPDHCTAPAPVNHSPPSMDPRALESAFALFSEASAQLSGAYQALQARVERLAGELAVANGELKRQYLEKEALSARLAGLLEALPGGVVVVDGDGRVSQANPAARALLGDDLPGSAWKAVAAARIAPTSNAREWEAGPPGRRRRVTLSESPLEAGAGQLLLLNDVTEASAVQRELERHKRLSAMGEMAAGLAHQLRTPLATALLHAANLSRSGLAEADRARFSERLRERLLHLERMIQEMLVFVRGSSAGREVVEAGALVHEAVQIMEPQMAGRSVRLEVSPVPAATLRGARKALSGMLVNLLENALQACEAGGSVRLAASLDGDRIAIEVRDDGRGVTPEDQERLFEPFFTTRQEGTGLGLAIVRSVAEAHGGEVAVKSRLGKGAAFTVRLPIEGAGSEAATAVLARVG